MKPALLCCALILTFTACDKHKSRKDGIYGKWKSVIAAYSIGGPMEEKTIDAKDVHYLTFEENGHYANTDPAAQQFDRFTSDSKTFTLTNSHNTGKFVYGYQLEGDTLKTWGVTSMCIEGCYTKYVAVK